MEYDRSVEGQAGDKPALSAHSFGAGQACRCVCAGIGLRPSRSAVKVQPKPHFHQVLLRKALLLSSRWLLTELFSLQPQNWGPHAVAHRWGGALGYQGAAHPSLLRELAEALPRVPAHFTASSRIPKAESHIM